MKEGFHLRLFAILLISWSCYSTPGTRWEPVTGLCGGHITAIEGSGDTLFCATESGGLFWSSDGGVSWSKVNSAWMEKIYSLAFHDGILYVGSYFEGIYRSKDCGLSWAKFDVNKKNDKDVRVYRIAKAGSLLYAGTDDGLFISADSGATWSSEGAFLDGASIKDVAQVGDFLFVSSGSLLRSSDGGVSWAKLDIGNAVAQKTRVLGSGLYHLTNKGVMRSSDNGLTWQSIAAGDALDDSITAIAEYKGMKIAAGKRIYMLDSDTDAWKLVEGQLQTGRVVCLMPSDKNLLIGSNHGVYAAADLDSPLIFRSDGMNGFCMVKLWTNQRSIYASTYYSGIFRSRNGGQSWEHFFSIDNGCIISMFEKDTIVLVGVDSYDDSIQGLYRSADDGISWRRVVVESATAPNAFEMKNNTIIAGTSQSRDSDGGIAMSSDGGLTWEVSHSNRFCPGIKDVHFYGDYLFAASEDCSPGDLFRSQDDGYTWETIYHDGGTTYQFFASNDRYLFANLDQKGVFRSSDYGESWTIVSNDILNNYEHAQAVAADNNILMIGTERNGVFLSEDDGESFSNVSEGLPDNIRYYGPAEIKDITIAKDIAFAGLQAHGLYWLSLDTANAQLGTDAVAGKKPQTNSALSSVNVLNHRIILTYANSAPVKESPLLYGLNGKWIQPPCEYFDNKVILDVSHLASGCYILEQGHAGSIPVVIP
ncbi:MAG: WD40/YVTN/BNR-like repeat-containing protein [Chitinispirillaceae bacterium]